MLSLSTTGCGYSSMRAYEIEFLLCHLAQNPVSVIFILRETNASRLENWVTDKYSIALGNIKLLSNNGCGCSSTRECILEFMLFFLAKNLISFIF